MGFVTIFCVAEWFWHKMLCQGKMNVEVGAEADSGECQIFPWKRLPNGRRGPGVSSREST